MTKTLPLEALSFLASCTPPLFVAVLFPCSVTGIRRSDVNSVVEISVAKSLDWAVVSRAVVNVLVEIFLTGTVVVSFRFVNSVVITLLVVLKLVSGVVTCEDIVVVRHVSLLLAVETMVEVVVTTVSEEEDDVQNTIISLLTPVQYLNFGHASWVTSRPSSHRA